jgi:UPF0755 protein
VSGRSAWLISLALISALSAGAVLLSLGSPGAILDEVPSFNTAAPAQGDELVVVEIPAGASAEAIANMLFERGVIASPRQFQTLVGLLGYEDRLVVGTYDFEPGLLTLEVIERIRNGVTSQLVVTIPEGLQAAEIFDRLAAATRIPRTDFLAAADPSTAGHAVAAGTLAADRPLGASLEGYLFPSTYVISRLDTASNIVRLMLLRFDDQLSPELRSEIASGGRSLHDLLTIASIVEREAILPRERPISASVFWNRVDAGMRLEADPTVQYAVAAAPASVASFGHWKSPLMEDDLNLASPYNTYLVEGIPPTPIASPGLDSILAALRPHDTPYFFFVASGDGGHLFAETFEEHQANVDSVQGPGEEQR